MEAIAIFTTSGNIIENSQVLENLFQFDERLNRSKADVLIQGKPFTLDKHWSHDGGISICDAGDQIVGEVRYGEVLNPGELNAIQKVSAKFF